MIVKIRDSLVVVIESRKILWGFWGYFFCVILVDIMEIRGIKYNLITL